MKVKKGNDKKRYDGRKGYYPVAVTKSGKAVRKPFSAEEAPTEAGYLNLDERLTDAVLEVSDTFGASRIKTDRKINTYLNTSRELLAEAMAKSKGATSQANQARVSDGEREFIPKLDNVIDKLSTLSDKEVNSLKAEVIKLSEEYKGIDPEASNVDKMIFAAGVAKNQDWSSLKPLREKAGLTKEEILQLIQSPEDAGWAEKLGFKAVRAAASMKDFRKGGKVPMIKRKDGSYSPRGLWDNIRANRGSGKKPTKAMNEAKDRINNEG
tara:strand:- start:7623 stop:8423 length:801 start_codon:yes stop_codon:yes gene_type:complete